jgi:predicted nucleic acid-binding protein
VIVVDTNTIAYLYFPSRYTTSVVNLLNHDSDWAAPRLWRSEFRNILATYLRQNAISISRALEIQQLAELLMSGNEFDVDSANVLVLASQSNCSAYDCEFVYLAQSQNTQLITSDRKLLRRFPDTAMTAEASLQ